MSEAQLTAAGDSRFELSGTLDFASVPQIWPALDAALRDGATLTLALGGVERANSAGLVLLIEALDVARARGCTLHFSDMPDELRDLAHLSNCDALVGSGEGATQGSAAAAPRAADD